MNDSGPPEPMQTEHGKNRGICNAEEMKINYRWKWGITLFTLILFTLLGVLMSVGNESGKKPEASRLDRMSQSEQWLANKKRFTNKLTRIDGSLSEMAYRYFFDGSKHREPKKAQIPTVDPAETWKTAPESGLRITWLGHSTFLVEIDGVRTLVDPVWSERASPFSWAGPKRFYAPLTSIDSVLPLDAVVISHDHYDHLDRQSVFALSKHNLRWIVPLGVGAHLEHWGISPERITELDWWEDTLVGEIRLTATPARHFSGRSVFFADQNATLWAGWAWNGPKHSVFYSGDTAMHPEFAEIGERLGPFDITLMENGAYNTLWADVHMGPEQAVLAHQLVRGKVMLPVHWGLFDLALHGWTEPAERVVAAAKRLEVTLGILRPGASYDLAHAPNVDRWWPEIPWDSGEDAPVWSSSVESLLSPFRDEEER